MLGIQGEQSALPVQLGLMLMVHGGQAACLVQWATLQGLLENQYVQPVHWVILWVPLANPSVGPALRGPSLV